MIPQVRYQVFLSSTYEDLRSERQEVTQAILEAGHFLSGMELFPASNDSQWELIKRVISESDYYIVIVGGRYGDTGPLGVSYTEMEYDYAIECGLPVLGFVNGNPDGITFDKTEKGEAGRAKLDKFRSKVMSRTCRKYINSSDLGKEVMKSLVSETRVRPRVGWVRADQARSVEDFNRERRLADDLAEAEREIEKLSRALRDGAVLGDEIDIADLSQGDDLYPFNVGYMSSTKNVVFEKVHVTWNEIFSNIGPSMYGYILKKAMTSYDSRPTYLFESSLIHLIRSKIFEKVQNRRIDISPSQIDDIIIHLKELGLVEFTESKDNDSPFRGITLTEQGERELSRLKIVRR